MYKVIYYQYIYGNYNNFSDIFNYISSGNYIVYNIKINFLMQKILLTSAMLVAYACAADTSAWKQRTVYQLLTDRFAKSNGDHGNCNITNYCGGDFEGIADNLQYIKDLGFDAISISPVIDNLDGGYHGYWARHWDQINSHFGSADELKDLVGAAHDMEMWVMVDVVANHVAPVGNNFS